MMHADLIDQDDLLGQLRSIGFEMPSGATAEQACAQAVCGLTEDRARALRQLVEKMLSGSATILPAVRQLHTRPCVHVHNNESVRWRAPWLRQRPRIRCHRKAQSL